MSDEPPEPEVLPARKGRPFTTGHDPRRNVSQGPRPSAMVELAELARARLPRAIERLGEIIDTSDNEVAVVGAAKVLFERGLGSVPKMVLTDDEVEAAAKDVDPVLAQLLRLARKKGEVEP